MTGDIKWRVNRTLSPLDAMYGGNADHYFEVGASALDSILHAVNIAGIHPGRILDFGCGAGRVTRWMRAAFPNAELEGCDLESADLEFVRRTFRANTWISATNADELKPRGTYDLIWIGSVFTHLSLMDTLGLFDVLSTWLNYKGVMVLTSHGRYPKSHGPQADYYGIAEEWDRTAADFQLRDFGYADYPGTPGYGISLIKLSWWATLVCSREHLRLVTMTEQAWDNHQDVIAVQRVTPKNNPLEG